MTVTEEVQRPVGAADAAHPRRRWTERLPVEVMVAHLVGVALVTLLHSYAAWDAGGPVMFRDELGYLLNGRALSGNPPGGRVGPMGFYQAGWPLLTVPLHWLISDPVTLYRAILWEVAVLGGLQVLPLSWLAGRVLRVPTRWRVPLGVVAASIPGRAALGGYALAEAAYTLTFLVLLVTLGRWRARPDRATAVALGVAGGFTYTVHGKGLPVAALTLGVFALDLVRSWWGARSERSSERVPERPSTGEPADSSTGEPAEAAAGVSAEPPVAGPGRPGPALAGIVATGATVLATVLVHRWLSSTLYDLEFDRSGRVLEMVGRMRPRASLATGIGFAWYPLTATVGLAAVGLVTLARTAWSDLRGRRFDLPAFYLAAAVGLAVVSLPLFAVIVGKGGNRLDYLVYGRHWDSMLPFAVLVGLAVITTTAGTAPAATRRRALVTIGAATVLTVAVTVALVQISLPGYLSGLPIAGTSMAGLLAWVGPSDWELPIWGPTALACGALVVCLGLVVAGRWGRPVVPAMFGAVFVLLTVQGEHRFMQPFDRPWQHLLTAQDEVEDLGVTEVGYDLDGIVPNGRNGYQFLLPAVDFVEFHGTSEPPPTDVVIAGRDWPLAAELGAVPVAVEPDVDQSVWVLPGPRQDRLRADGALCRPGSASSAGSGGDGAEPRAGSEAWSCP